MKKAAKDITIFVLIAALILLMVISAIGMILYVSNTIHNERTTYLTAQTESTAGLINKVINQYKDYAKICENIIHAELNEGDDIVTFMNYIQSKLYLEEARLILVDTNCSWYGEEGTSGRITSIENYADDTPEELVYITTGIDASIESICYRVRLSVPVTVDTPKGSAQIVYCTVIYYMNNFSKEISSSFPYSCNSFIVDETGLMLYKNYSLGTLLAGSNIFSKYERAEFKYDDTGAEQLAKIKGGKIAVAEMKIENEDYFICTAPLNTNNWYASFVINTNELAAGSYITSIFIYMIVLGLVFTVSTITALMMILRYKDSKQLLEKKQLANEFLEKASNAKSEFISNMSHDIRTPINGIMGMTAIAKEEDNSDKTNECLSKIELSSKYLLSLVNDVLDMSSIENDKLKLELAPTKLKDVLTECMVVTESLSLGRKLSFATNFEELNETYILADSLRLKQVFINILSNSIKFTEDGGNISFTANTKEENGEVIAAFEIKDTGCGMSEEFLSKIWDRFSQDSAGPRSKYKGTGLGMAITKKLIDAMDASIFVESELGKGSSFKINAVFTKAEQETQRNNNHDNNIQGLSILIAEDNDINMEIATELLSRKGAKLDQAEDGQIALDKYLEAKPYYYDAILMDIMMPKLNGIDCAKAIRSSDKEDREAVPIIAMTADISDESIKEALASGMNAYITKPLNINEILNAISMLTKKED